jgi:hypothetical protein
MKKIFLLLGTILVSITSFAQIQQPDTLKLSDKELFGESGNLNNVGILQSYVNFSKDVLSTSNLSISMIGKQISTTLNLGYNRSTFDGKWEHKFSTSINPIWKYYGVGYGISRNMEKRTTTLQAFYSTDFNFQNDFTISFIDVIRTKKYGTFGYSLIASKTFWGSYEGQWQGKYIVDTNGNWVSNIYPQMSASSEMNYRGMVMYTYTYKTKIVNISPQVFFMSDVYKTFRNDSLNISYLNKFNLDLYYGTSLDWKITKKFVLNTNIRFNTTLDEASNEVGYKKINPISLMVGTNFQF